MSEGCFPIPVLGQDLDKSFDARFPGALHVLLDILTVDSERT
jgi:hypothetical protein